MHNYFFEAYYIDSNISLGMINIRTDIKIWEMICKKYFTNNDDLNSYIDDPYNFIYGKNIKEELRDIYPDVILQLSKITNNNLVDENIGIRQTTSYDYRIYNEQYDNECKFVEYIMSEKSKRDKDTIITEDILLNAGFKYLEKESELYENITRELRYEKYKVFRIWTNDDKSPLKLDIDNGLNNRGTKCHLHIDNCDCCTIGSADIDNVWEFNTLMEVFGSKFRL